MKAIAINGSPRKGGNTEALLKKVLEPLTDAGWDTEFIQYLGFGLDKGEVQQDEEGLRNMADLGQTIAWLGKAIQQSLDRISDC